MKKTFIICLEKQKDEGFLVKVPDLNISTYGINFDDAKNMAIDAISATLLSYEDHNEKLPKMSTITQIKKNRLYSKDMIVQVPINTLIYRRNIESKSVRRNVTLPLWLDKEVKKAKINVSKILQEALISDLNLQSA